MASTMNPLPGLGLIGCPYNVLGYYASPKSVNASLPLFTFLQPDYDPSKDPEAQLFQTYATSLQARTYYLPQGYTATARDRSTVASENTFSAQEMQAKVNGEAQGSGFYDGFGASFEASFSAGYLTNESYYSFSQFGIVESYAISLGGIDDLRSQLTSKVDQLLNGTDDPETVIKQLGTHFVWSAVFGGRLTYSQSISKYFVDSEAQARATVSANYMNFIQGGVSGGSSIDMANTASYSSATFQSAGGTPDSLTKGYENWAKSVADGNFAMIDFDSNSLVPISELATDSDRRDKLSQAIQDVLSKATFSVKSLTWDTSLASGEDPYYAASSHDSGEVEFQLDSDNEVIVGLAGAEDNDSNVSKLAAKVLNLSTGDIYWRAWKAKNTPISYNASDYTTTVDIPESTGKKGVALVGLKARSVGSSFDGLELLYQEIDPTGGQGSFLQPTVQSEKGGSATDSFEVAFDPGAGNQMIVIGVGLRVQNGDFMVLNLYRTSMKFNVQQMG